MRMIEYYIVGKQKLIITQTWLNSASSMSLTFPIIMVAVIVNIVVGRKIIIGDKIKFCYVCNNYLVKIQKLNITKCYRLLILVAGTYMFVI